MSNVHGPCLGCKERHMKCHSECEKYKAFKEKVEEEKSKIADYKGKYYCFPKVIGGRTTAEYKEAKQKGKL
jgi:hypothetical protein